jgi:hypothetical protein
MRVTRLLVIAVLLLSGCTWSSVRTVDTRPPASPTHVLPRDPFRSESKASWSQYQLQFEKGVREWLARNRSDRAFASLDERPPAVPLPPGSVILTGTIASMSYGIPALRYWIGSRNGGTEDDGGREIEDEPLQAT